MSDESVKVDSKPKCSLNVDISNEISSFGVQDKMNNFIGVQKAVISILNKEAFFCEVINEETGMVISINAKGIKETLGNGKRFQALPRRLKEMKIATLRKLPELISKAHLIEDNVPNKHGSSALFTYFRIDVDVNGVDFNVRIDVRKTSSMNRFWLHNIDITEKNSQLLCPDIM